MLYPCIKLLMYIAFETFGGYKYYLIANAVFLVLGECQIQIQFKSKLPQCTGVDCYGT